MAKVSELPVYIANVDFIESISPTQFARELKKVIDADCRISPFAKSIDEAFVWFDTPQGSDFWADLYKEVINNKREHHG